MQLHPNQAFYLLINNRAIPSMSSTLAELYRDDRDKDGYLYMTYASHEMFGWNIRQEGHWPYQHCQCKMEAHLFGVKLCLNSPPIINCFKRIFDHNSQHLLWSEMKTHVSHNKIYWCHHICDAKWTSHFRKPSFSHILFNSLICLPCSFYHVAILHVAGVMYSFLIKSIFSTIHPQDCSY